MTRRPEEFTERFFWEMLGAMIRVSTFGLDGWWNRKIIKKFPKTTDLILEQASGTGSSSVRSNEP
jgi:hypothetical protein